MYDPPEAEQAEWEAVAWAPSNSPHPSARLLSSPTVLVLVMVMRGGGDDGEAEMLPSLGTRVT